MLIIICFLFNIFVFYLLFLLMFVKFFCFFFSSRRRHTRCALVTGVQTCALPICGVQEFLGLVLIPEVQQDETARRLLSRRPISHVILTHRIGSIGTSLSDIGPQ